MTWRRIATELGHVHAVTLTGSAGSVVHVTPLNTVQTGVLRACLPGQSAGHRHGPTPA
jgi:hypothetical protein